MFIAGNLIGVAKEPGDDDPEPRSRSK